MDHLEDLIRDIENTDTPVPARYIVELAQYPGMSAKLKDIDWAEGDIRIKADILAAAREGVEMSPRERKKLEALLSESYAEVTRLRAEDLHQEAHDEYLYYLELARRCREQPTSSLPEVLLGLAVLAALASIGYLLWSLP